MKKHNAFKFSVIIGTAAMA